MSRAVDMCPSSVRPWALRKVVRVMPSARAVRFMRRAKAASEPEIASPIAVAASLADRIAAARMRKRNRIVEPARRPSFDGGSAAAFAEMRTCVSRSISPRRTASNAM
jgi:hypothetical protein